MPIDHSLNTSLIQADSTSGTVAARLNASLIAVDTSTPKNISYFNESTLGIYSTHFNESFDDNTHAINRDTGIQTNTQQDTPGFNVVQGRCKTYGKYNSDKYLNTFLIQADSTSAAVAARLNASLIAVDTSTPKNVSFFNESTLGIFSANFNESFEDGEQTTADWLILYDTNGNAKNSIRPQNGLATIQ